MPAGRLAKVVYPGLDLSQLVRGEQMTPSAERKHR
jgi:hypothetical protein